MAFYVDAGHTMIDNNGEMIPVDAGNRRYAEFLATSPSITEKPFASKVPPAARRGALVRAGRRLDNSGNPVAVATAETSWLWYLLRDELATTTAEKKETFYEDDLINRDDSVFLALLTDAGITNSTVIDKWFILADAIARKELSDTVANSAITALFA